MIVCEKCNKKFKTAQALTLMTSYEDGTVEDFTPGNVRPGGEDFYGCPNCRTEIYLKFATR